ncbi:hypothetical protein [Persicirhabdus sediminis]|nr:hypothetical protein [Persicirhabdus sediminis]
MIIKITLITLFLANMALAEDSHVELRRLLESVEHGKPLGKSLDQIATEVAATNDLDLLDLALQVNNSSFLNLISSASFDESVMSAYNDQVVLTMLRTSSRFYWLCPPYKNSLDYVMRREVHNGRSGKISEYMRLRGWDGLTKVELNVKPKKLFGYHVDLFTYEKRIDVSNDFAQYLNEVVGAEPKIDLFEYVDDGRDDSEPTFSDGLCTVLSIDEMRKSKIEDLEKSLNQQFESFKEDEVDHSDGTRD